MEREIQIGQIYKHFKGTYHKIMMLAKNYETLEQMVIYTHEGTDEIWARPYSMFNDATDHKKYPTVSQEYRFELVSNHD